MDVCTTRVCRARVYVYACIGFHLYTPRFYTPRSLISNVALSFPHSTIRIYHYFSCTNFHGHRRRRFLSRLLMLNVLNPFRCENYCGLVYTVIRYTRYRSFRDYEVVVCERKSYSPHPWNIGRCDIVGYNRGGSRIGRMLWDIGFRYWRVVSG